MEGPDHQPYGGLDRHARDHACGDRMLRLVDDLESRLRSLCGVIDANDARDIRELARRLVADAREQADCGLIGIEDDGLLEQMEFAALTERVEDIVAFCRLAIESGREQGGCGA